MDDKSASSPLSPQPFKVLEVTHIIEGTRLTVSPKCINESFQAVYSEVPLAKGWLKNRLSFAFARRRSRLEYWRPNWEKAKTFEQAIRSRTSLEQARVPTAVQKRDSNVESGQSPVAELQLSNRLEESIESTRSPYLGLEGLTWKEATNFPKVVQLDAPESDLVCPVCFIPAVAADAKGDSWVQHVSEDLKPYTCLLEDCKTPDHDFGTMGEWVQHMTKEKSVPDLFTRCPLCSYGHDMNHEEIRDERILQQHITRHMHTLALLSINPTASNESSNQEVHYRSPPENLQSLGSPPVPGITYRSQSLYSMFRQRDDHLPSRGSILGTSPATLYGRGFSDEGDETCTKSETRVTLNPITQTINSLQMQEPLPLLYSNIDHPQNQAVTPSKAPSENLEATEPFDVLVVEDNIVNQRVLMALLRKRGLKHVLTVANNGQEALDIFNQKRFDIILMDISMPIMGGIEATKKIREYELDTRLQRTPIIGMLADAMSSSRLMILEAGMEDYISKPLRFKTLADKIAKWGPLGRRGVRNDGFRGSRLNLRSRL